MVSFDQLICHVTAYDNGGVSANNAAAMLKAALSTVVLTG